MRADRLLSILLRLQAKRHMTAQELAGEMGVSTRTIYRDIDALALAGIPIYTQRGENGGCYLDEGYQLSLTDLMLSEVQALFIQGGSKPLEALNIDRKVQDGLHKLLATLPSSHQKEAQSIQQRLYIDSQAWTQQVESLPFLDELQQAVWTNQLVDIVYQSFQKPAVERRIAPYGLVVKTHIWYLVAKPIAKKEERIYRVSRIQDLKATEISFERADGFQLKESWERLSQAFETKIQPAYQVRFEIDINFLKALDFLILDRYTIVEQDAAKAVVDGAFYNINEARHTLIGFGRYVDVLKPAELAESIYQIAKSIVEKRET
ncbi:MAG: YafY family protein [Chloroflexota bacterium]